MRIIHVLMYVLLLLLVSCGPQKKQNYVEEGKLDLQSLKKVADRDEGLFIREMLNIGEDSVGVWTLKAFLHESQIVIAEALVLRNDTTYSTRYYYNSNEPYATMQTVKFGGKIISVTTVYFDSDGIIDIESKPEDSQIAINRSSLHAMLYEQSLKLSDKYIGEEKANTDKLVPLKKFQDLLND